MIINLLYNKKLLLTIGFTLLLLGCDDRTPTKSDTGSTSSSNYTLEIAAQPFATDVGGNDVIVGEDIIGDFVKTRIDIILKDSTGNVLPNKLIEFSATVGGESFGKFNVSSSYTNADGLATVNFTL